MTREEIEAQLIAFITEEILIGETGAVHPHDHLLADGILDSLGLTRVIAFVDRQYGARVPPQDLTVANFGSVASAAGYLIDNMHRLTS